MADMTADQYIASILAKYEVPRGPTSPAERLGGVVAGPLRAWAGPYLHELRYSGSYAKHTGVRGTSDVDVFISFGAGTPATLKDLYGRLYRVASDHGWSPRQQNVSIGVTIGGTRGDLVPGKLQPGQTGFHSLYVRRRDTWTQTNVRLHEDTVRTSGRLREIRALKIWRMLRNLEFPSMYLELFTMRALSGRSTTTLADNFLSGLIAIKNSLGSTRIVDPANSANVLSDDLTVAEKNLLAASARDSSQETSWGRIIW
jgi:hypothetical protein